MNKILVAVAIVALLAFFTLSYFFYIGSVYMIDPDITVGVLVSLFAIGSACTFMAGIQHITDIVKRTCGQKK